MQTKQKKYHWLKTWHGAEDDYIATDGAQIVGRIYLHCTSEGVRWLWAMPKRHDPEHSMITGSAENAEAAASELGQAYEGRNLSIGE